MGVKFPAVDRGTIRRRAESVLREAIVDGRLAPGERLIERELCESLQVSRPSLREALRSLEAEGLIEVVAHRGPSVANVSVEQARELYAVREVLEGLAARTFAEQPDRSGVVRLQHAVDRLREIHAAGGDPAALLAAKTDFYRALFDGAGNSALAASMERLLARISLLRRKSFLRPERLPASIAELDQIVAAIRDGDADRAERATRQHVRSAALAAFPLMHPPLTTTTEESVS